MDPDVAKNRAEAQQIMKQPLRLWAGQTAARHGDHARNVAAYRDPAVILIDQLKQIYIDGTLNPIDTGPKWH